MSFYNMSTGGAKKSVFLLVLNQKMVDTKTFPELLGRRRLLLFQSSKYSKGTEVMDCAGCLVALTVSESFVWSRQSFPDVSFHLNLW